ncbi:MAG: hypothetical protein GF405_02910 [Candidatus Eisenbacteria bacterium]|nr:hypothetical protein [Candidatus Eisenbacteria bacterium]
MPAETAWRCEIVEGEPHATWPDRGNGWSSAGGVLTAVVTSSSFDDPRSGAPDQESAVRDAAARAVAVAGEQLAARGVPRAPEGASADRATEELASTGSAQFPRISFKALRVERCLRDAHPESSTYRAAALVEYPIALLRGDVSNAVWERRRLAREARVLSSSADRYLDEGRWTEAALDAGRARAALLAAGARPAGGAGWEIGERVETITVVPPLEVRSEQTMAAVPRGSRADERVSFRWSFELDGRTVPAVGVPVGFSHGMTGIVVADAATDKDGRAGLTIRRVWSPPGGYTVTTSIDTAALAAAGAHWRGAVQETTARVYIIEPGHGLSVCLDVSGTGPADATQVRSGLEQRLAPDGYELVPCGPATDILVTARLSLSTVEKEVGWTARVLLEAEAVDQNTAGMLGASEIFVEETVDRGRREAEVLVLKEAGRLLGVYLSGRAPAP